MSSDYLFYVSVSRVFAVVGFFASILFGLTLILLNTFVVKRVNSTYKYFMNVFTLQGILFSAIEFVSVPNVHSYNAGYMFFLLENKYDLDFGVLRVFLAIYSGLLCSTMTMLAVQFLYRYWTVFDTKKLEHFKSWKILFWFSYSAILGSIWISGLCIVENPSSDSLEYFRSDIKIRYQKAIEDLPSLIMMPYYPSDGSIRWSAWGLTLTQAIISSIQYGIMGYCGWLMHKKMDQTISSMSNKTKQLHKQFFKVLVIQITAPTIFLLIPLSFIIYLPFFDLEVSIPTGTLLCSFTVYVAVDSVIVMTVVTDYRKSLKKLLVDSVAKFHSWLTKGNRHAPTTTTA